MRLTRDALTPWQILSDDPPPVDGSAMLNLNGPALTTKFIMALHDASIRNPASWRRVSAIGARTGIKGVELDQVVARAVAAGLVQHPEDNSSLVSLTNKGWLLAGL